jgi:hypothetical protein
MSLILSLILNLSLILSLVLNCNASLAFHVLQGSRVLSLISGAFS